MTFQIKIDNNQMGNFLKIIESLKDVGLIESFKEMGSLSLEGQPLQENDLMTILKQREDEIDQGNFLTQEELMKFMKLWKQLK